MILEYIIFFTLVPAILFLFIKLTMPAHLRTIKITVDGLNEEFNLMFAEAKADVASIRLKLDNR